MPDRRRLRIREIRTADDPALDPAFRLITQGFHPEERVTRRDWVDTLRERAAGVWTDLSWHLMVAQRGNEVLGVATGSYLGSVNVGVIGYLVISPEARGLGLGPRLRNGLRVRFERDARRIVGRPLEALVGEVRADNPWLRSLVTRDRALALDFPYRQPALRPKQGAVPLVLYYQPLARPRRSLSAAELRRLLYAIWRRLYRIPKPLNRPTFRQMLAALARRRRIGSRLPVRG